MSLLPSPFRRLIPFLGLLLLLLPGFIARAAGPAQSHFDIHANLAERSLKTFAAQSGLEILFVTEMVAGTRTKAVKGDFTPAEALNRMLAGTGLSAVQDSKAKGFTISRDPPRADSQKPKTAKKKHYEKANLIV